MDREELILMRIAYDTFVSEVTNYAQDYARKTFGWKPNRIVKSKSKQSRFVKVFPNESYEEVLCVNTK